MAKEKESMVPKRRTVEGWVAEKLGATRDTVSALNQLSLAQSVELCRSAVGMLLTKDEAGGSYGERLTDEILTIYYRGLSTKDLEREILAELQLESKSRRGKILRLLADEYGIKPKTGRLISDRPSDNIPRAPRVPADAFMDRPDEQRPQVLRASPRPPAPTSTPPEGRIKPEDDPRIQAILRNASLRPPGMDYATYARQMAEQGKPISTEPPPEGVISSTPPPTHSSIRPSRRPTLDPGRLDNHDRSRKKTRR